MFCRNCGRALEDGGTCECQNTTTQLEEQPGQQESSTQSQWSYDQPQYQQQQYEPTPQYQPQQPYYNPAQSQPYGQPQVNVTYQAPIQAPARPSNGIATGGFVCALLGLIFSWVPIAGWVLWVLGLIFSIIGLALAPRRKAGLGLAITGLILSLIGLILIIVLGGLICASIASW